MDPVVTLTVRLCLALLFAAAALHKLSDLRAFRRTLRRYDVLPRALLAPAAAGVVAAEAATAAGLAFSGRFAFGGAALLVLYAGAMALNLVRGRADLDCGCMGPAAKTPVSGALVARNLVLAAAALVAAAPVDSRPLVWVDALTVIAAACTAAACWSAAERMLALAPVRARMREARQAR